MKFFQIRSSTPPTFISAVSDIRSVVSMTDRISGSAIENGSRAAVGENLITSKRNRDTSAMPLNNLSSAGSVNDREKQTYPLDTSELQLTVTSRVKWQKVESPIQPLNLLAPASYPKCSPVLLDELPDEQRESEDLSIKARSRFDNSLRGLSQPVSLGELARTWDACAHKILVEYAQQTGGGTFSTTYGTWEKCFEEDCATPVWKLRQVVDAMVVEMHAGLASDGGSKLQMLLAFVDTLPGGNEDGVYCALDLRGTSCRVLKVQLGGSGPKIINHKVEQQQILKELVSSTSEVLLHFIALTLKEFIEREENGQAPGVLIKWTKGFTIEDVVGKDVSQCLEEAMWENGLHMQVAALTSGLSLKAKMIVVRVCDIVTRGAARLAAAGIIDWAQIVLNPIQLVAGNALLVHAYCTAAVAFSVTFLFSLGPAIAGLHRRWWPVGRYPLGGWEGGGARSRGGQSEEDCATPARKLRQVVDAMVVEMHAGLASDGGSKLQMLLAFVDTLPGGNEDGVYCALDLRGTSCRVLKVQLGGSGPKIINHKVEQQQILKELVSSTSEVLLHFIALTLKEFIEREENGQAPGSKKELGFTFSFPIRQLSVSSGVLIKWTKGFTIEDVVGKDVSQCLEEAMWENGLHMQVAALTSGLSLKAKMIVVRVCDIVTRGAARTSFFWIPAEINIPASYPKCSPVLLDELPDEQRESEDLSIKARSRFDNSLRGLSQPVSLGELARTWDACAHKILVEYAQQTGGGTFSTTYGTWENV
ncbi:hypothetical protein MUK42_02272 [Musa troglodytarum]|uniref:Hexokinase N-terminal domain-containing protein n=1 Tax=Musa troglodytarum TaxID=320322 RepID=A0A9E7EUI8_9LILI|nr:hypothetical protein MUK42_02272 [Musa troglodytarum]